MRYNYSRCMKMFSVFESSFCLTRAARRELNKIFRVPCLSMANPIAFLFLSLLFSKEIHPSTAKECKFEHKYVCGVQDCNCRYVGKSGVSFSKNDDGQVCDKCEVFCRKAKHINCDHGACDEQKGCICRDCWNGETCSTYQNNQPEFGESVYFVEIKDNTNVGDEIFRVSATDPDLESCVNKDNCPCGRVKYSISKGNENGFFYINPNDGAISLARNVYDYDSLFLTIVADNEGNWNIDEQSQKALTTVVITLRNAKVETSHRNRRSLHHRARRSVTTYDALSITFKPDSNETFFPAGSIINFRLYLIQNSSASPEDLTGINIGLTSENLDLGNGQITVNISNGNETVSSVERINSGTIKFSTSKTLSSIGGYMEIKFYGLVPANLEPLALLQVAFTMNATSAAGSITYGPKYSTEIYTTYPEIKFHRDEIGDVLVESVLDYDVNITLPYFNFTFLFELNTNVNEFRFLSVENVYVGEISSSVVAQNSHPTPTMYTGAEDNITGRAVLDFGKLSVLNKLQSANTIKLSFSVKVNDHHLLKNASTHWVGAGALSGQAMLWVGQDAITISKNEPYLYAEINALNNTDSPTRYRANDILKFSWSVKHAPNASYEDAKNVKVLFYFSKSVFRVNNDQDSGLFGGQLTHSTEDERDLLSFVKGDGSLTIGSELGGVIVVQVKESVPPLADLNVEIKIHYQTAVGDDRPIRTYKPNPGYLAGVPSFKISSNIPDGLINIGQSVEISVDMLINRITLEGKLFIILPVQNSSAIMRFVPHESFTTKSYGSNIVVTSKFTDAKATFNSTTNDTTFYDRAEIDLDLIKNKALTTAALASVDANTVTIKFKIVLEDKDNVMNSSSYKIGIGVKGSEHMVWISQISFTSNLGASRRPRLLIEAYSNATDGLTQGSIVEYNFTISHKNDSDAHAFSVKVVWMLPTYTEYLHINKKSHNKMSSTKSLNNVIFKLSKLDFGDTPSVSFSVALDHKKTISKSGKSYAVTPVALTYKNSDETYYEPLLPMSVRFVVPEKSTPAPPNAVNEFYQRGFLVDSTSSAIYICSVATKRNRPSCFWTNTLGATWRAVNVMVINIIGIDNVGKMVYGIGNNKLSYMKYVPDKGRWYSISRDHWEQAKPTVTDSNVIKIEDDHSNENDPVLEKQKDVLNGEKWGANMIGVYHYTNTIGWQRKALWNCCH